MTAVRPARPSRAARRIEVSGTVQGVGFRPFVYRVARDLGLDGSVRNDGGRVVIEAAGAPEALAALVRRLRSEAPPQARVRSVRARHLDDVHPACGSGFLVAASSVAASSVAGGDRELPPDLATCADCLRELFDPEDRRYRYPFLNCTQCGPRATIVDDLPYDRQRTVMRAFPLCAACADEYADPGNRRYHAEPVACPVCGPRLSWRAHAAAAVTAIGEDALRAAVAAVRGGSIVAVKGLGGYQLVCDATDEQVVARLRQRKRRPVKPLAVMVADADTAATLAHVSPAEGGLLVSTARPIVLLQARPDAVGTLAPSVSPGTRQVGLFLPTTALHALLLAELTRPLVVTSGNRADEPIACDDADALARLGGIADAFLASDRPIRARYDDSVTRVVGGQESVVRRARGYAPAPLELPVPARVPLLAVGAQLKHTFALASGDRAVLGPHGGDLEDADAFDAFTATLAHLSRLQAIEPELVTHDLHPGYLSTQYAARWPARRRVPVQHHHAHVASCAAEHGVSGPFLGVAYDGLGLGDDGTLWGGEVLVADLRGYRRLARFGRAPLPGGAAAVRRPVRTALGYLLGAEALPGHPPLDPDHAFTSRLDPREVAVVRRMVERGLNAPLASSAGRLFDAVSSLLGVRDDASYEGEAAVALEAAADEVPGDPPALPWRLDRGADGLLVYDPRPTLAAVLGSSDPAPVVAARFHTSLAEVTAALVERAARETGLQVVCLSGGVFQNRRLTLAVLRALRGLGVQPLINRRVPANDGGVSYGQAAVAAARTTEGR